MAIEPKIPPPHFVICSLTVKQNKTKYWLLQLEEVFVHIGLTDWLIHPQVLVEMCDQLELDTETKCRYRSKMWGKHKT